MKRLVLLTALAVFLISALLFQNDNSGGKTVIKFSSWGSKSEIEAVKALISEFEIKNPDIKIDLIHIPQNYFQKIHLLAASGLEPDVIFMNNQNIQMYINAGILEDLSPYFADKAERFYDEALNCFKKNGHLYAVPRDISNLVIYYNKDIFKKRGINMPDKIKDIFELRRLAEQVSSKDNFGINYEENPLIWLYYLSSNKGGAVSDDGKTVIIGRPESLEALNLYAGMINNDKTIPSKKDMGSMMSAQMFISGKLAMYLSGRWMTPKFREVINFDWDVIEFPAPHKVYIDASGWTISKNSKHKNEAVLFVKYISSTDALSKIAKTGLIIPADKEAVFQSGEEKPKNYKVFKTMLKNAKPSPSNENYAAVLDEINERAKEIFSGSKRAGGVFDEKTVSRITKTLHQ